MRRDDDWATLIVVIGLAAASLTGFVRESTVAHQLGAGRGADIYFVAYAVPEFFFVALPIILTPVYIPLFVGLREQVGDSHAWQFGLWVADVFLAILLVFTAVAVVVAPHYIASLSPGFSAPERAQAVRLTRLRAWAADRSGSLRVAYGSREPHTSKNHSVCHREDSVGRRSDLPLRSK